LRNAEPVADIVQSGLAPVKHWVSMPWLIWWNQIRLNCWFCGSYGAGSSGWIRTSNPPV